MYQSACVCPEPGLATLSVFSITRWHRNEKTRHRFLSFFLQIRTLDAGVGEEVKIKLSGVADARVDDRARCDEYEVTSTQQEHIRSGHAYSMRPHTHTRTQTDRQTNERVY
jgi:hypothetical protein